jgi:hypothetical protein
MKARNMNKGFVPLLGMLCIVGASGCETMNAVAASAGIQVPTGPTAMNLNPEDIDTRLAGIDRTVFFARELTFNKYDLPAFDQYFMQVARVRGELAALQEGLHRANMMLDTGELRSLIDGGIIAQALPEVQAMTPDQQQKLVLAFIMGNQATLTSMLGNNVESAKARAMEAFRTQAPNAYYLMIVMPVLIELAANLPNEVQNLINSGQTMVANAPAQLAGPQAILLPQITGDITDSFATLQECAGSVSDILGEAQQLCL